MRTRQVPKYRQEARFAEAFTWKAWEWAHDRTSSESGTDPLHLVWPTGARTAMASGEQEREHRHAKYVVTLTYDDDKVVRFEVGSEAEAARFATGSSHEVHREPDVLLVDGAHITPLALAP